MKLFIITFFICMVSQAEAACDYHLQLTNPTIEVADTEQVLQQNIQVRRGVNSDLTGCSDYRIYFSKGGANSYERKASSATGKLISYNLHKDINKSGVLKDFNDALTDSERLQGSAPEKELDYSMPYYVSLPGIFEQNFPKNDNYTDSVQANLYSYNTTSGEQVFQESKVLAMTYIVPRKMAVSLVNEGALFDASATKKVLNFGNLAQPTELGADIIIQSNTPYDVTLSSMNNGLLKHTQGETISYALKVNTLVIDLSTSSSIPVKVGDGLETTTSGNRYNVKVSITGYKANKLAGLYQDSITVSVIAK